MNLIYAEQYKPNVRSITGKPSAVMLVILPGNKDDNYFLLLHRTGNMSSYAGDWCLPGGKMEAQDDNLEAVAWRELEEETSIKYSQCRLVCQLDDFYSGKGELVRPFLVTLPLAIFNKTFKENSKELQGAVRIRCERMKKLYIGSPSSQVSTRKPAYQLEFKDGGCLGYVWGLTASIIAHANNIINRDDRLIDFGDSYIQKNKYKKSWPYDK